MPWWTTKTQKCEIYQTIWSEGASKTWCTNFSFSSRLNMFLCSDQPKTQTLYNFYIIDINVGTCLISLGFTWQKRLSEFRKFQTHSHSVTISPFVCASNRKCLLKHPVHQMSVLFSGKHTLKDLKILNRVRQVFILIHCFCKLWHNCIIIAR